MTLTFELPDDLLAATRAYARERGLCLEDAVEVSLRRLLAEPSDGRQPFRLCCVQFGDRGLTPAFEKASWAEILEASQREIDLGPDSPEPSSL